ncbi:3-phosphoshikimate 1-carboxyvinyltransferase [Tissierella sp. MSJ-40]|uniref:3-phosphoshikimate 1-carboxyvinyltransferase n=1 Tax=Tissierella simiarum TaxID=2841534 RepID=A0ABS6E614_9FIRM|nr:3-phosphoshikimate 1-carboxyvinyltransferase [Tissierella simiarum]MBU5438199.1 3-phosphoshikimate 1-carboxyvinyltransferase [Tissierella simiarum]
MIIKGKKRLCGQIRVPGDKSISHRGVMIGSIAEGETIIENILLSEDTIRTIECFRQMGVNIDIEDCRVKIKGVGLNGLKDPNKVLDCGNSGTAMRLISGILVGQQFPTTLIGDDSLNKRPMDRIIVPLSKMGANIKGVDYKYPPLKILPSKTPLESIDYELPVASAQVKSSILLACLYSNGKTRIIEKNPTRDHTERMLNYFGAHIIKEKDYIYMEPKGKFIAKNIYVPGDISSAAFLIVAATIIEGSSVIIKDVGLNPTRTGIINVINDMGGSIKIENVRILNNETIGDIHASYSPLKGIEIQEEILGTLIDEIPIIAVAAAFAKGKTIIKNAEELKYKETNRIKAMVNELKNMDANIIELPDGLIIEGKEKLKPATLKSYNDHRIAMALSIAAFNTEGESIIDNHECVNISYPNFYETLFQLEH